MTLDEIDAAARARGLAVRGAFRPTVEDAAPKGAGTLILLGPDEPAFWDVFIASPEYRDAEAHALDRWSKRVVSDLAAPMSGVPIFPYDGPPYAPFLHWAERSGESWSSPVRLLVHATAGLFISFRAALAVPEALDLPVTPENPCPTCADKPCETACPVGALAPGQDYDVPACVAYVQSAPDVACRTGCLVRRACPVSQSFGRVPEQSAFHMQAFLKD